LSLLVSDLLRGLLELSLVSCCCEKLVDEAGDSSGTQRKGNVPCCKPLPNNGSEDVTGHKYVCVSNSEL
jgi:hypothetical protein